MIVRSADFGKIFCNFCNNPIFFFFCLKLFDTFFKCLPNVNLLSKVNPKCFCDDAWEANLIQYKPLFFICQKIFKTFNKLPDILYSCNLNIAPSCQNLSNAFEMSRKTPLAS